MSEMLTVSKVLSDARALGIKLAPRSFWNYCEQGLLPKGRKLPGCGNCTYFPADTLLQLYVVLLLKDLKVPHSILIEACSDPTLMTHLKDRRPESLPPISHSKRRVAEEYKNVLLETVKRAISAEPPCAAPIVDSVLPPITSTSSSSSTVTTPAEVKGRKFRDAPEVAPEVTPEVTPQVTPEKPTQSGLKKGKQSGRGATKA
jgi:hypothetical protein